MRWSTRCKLITLEKPYHLHACVQKQLGLCIFKRTQSDCGYAGRLRLVKTFILILLRSGVAWLSSARVVRRRSNFHERTKPASLPGIEHCLT